MAANNFGYKLGRLSDAISGTALETPAAYGDLASTVGRGIGKVSRNVGAAAVPGAPAPIGPTAAATRARVLSGNAAGVTTTPTPPVTAGVPPLLARPAPDFADRVTGLSRTEAKAWEAAHPVGLLAGQKKPGDLSDEGQRLLMRAQENMQTRGVPATTSVGSGSPAYYATGKYGTFAAPSGEGTIASREADRFAALGPGAVSMADYNKLGGSLAQTRLLNMANLQ